MSPLEAAELSLEHPPDFAYFGDLHEEDGWGRAFGVHRDSDALERSNWQVITEDMRERFPDHFTTESASHWLVGWVETGRVRVLEDPSQEIAEDNLTDAFRAVLDWKEKLDGYPVADEEHYSELEWTDFREWVESEAKYAWGREHEEELPEALLGRVLELVSEECSSADDLPYEVLERAISTAFEGVA